MVLVSGSGSDRGDVLNCILSGAVLGNDIEF